MKVVIAVLHLLEGLAGDIVSLLIYFEQMNAQIQVLVDKHMDHVDTVSDIRSDMDSDPNQPLNEYDKRSFHNQLIEMKKLSVLINSLATLYAVVITNAINPGFEKVIQASHADMTGQSTSLVLAAKELEMKYYIEGAEEMCKTKSFEANSVLASRLAEIDEQEARKKRGRGWRSGVQRYQTSKQASQSVRSGLGTNGNGSQWDTQSQATNASERSSGGRNFVSRVFSRRSQTS
jgi:hypothetical protein